MTGAISFSGVSLEEARAERRVFLRTLAILLGVDESWVRVAIRRSAAVAPALGCELCAHDGADAGDADAGAVSDADGDGSFGTNDRRRLVSGTDGRRRRVRRL